MLPFPVFQFDFIEALTLIVIIIDFIMMYTFFKEIINPFVGIMISVLVTFLLVIPYGWFAWLIFFSSFAYSFFWGFQPWTWAKGGGKSQDEESGP